jgi:sugar lactone lactonase YvrE
VDELIRSRVHDALDVEQPDMRLRSRIIASLPADESATRRVWVPDGQWAVGAVAVLLTIALLAGVLYLRSGVFPARHGPPPLPKPVPALVSPEGIAVGPDGSVYVSDYYAGYVFRIRPDGTRSIVAGTGTNDEMGDGGLAINAAVDRPSGLTFAHNGDLLIADFDGQRIRRIDALGFITTIAGSGFDKTQGSGSFSGDGGPATSAKLSQPLGIAFAPTGELFVGDSRNGRVRRVDLTGMITSLDSSKLPRPQWIPGYLAFDAAGNLYVADRAPYPAAFVGGGCRIVKVSHKGVMTVIAGTGRCGFSGDGGPAVEATLEDPNGLAFDSAGNLYFATGNRIRRIDRNGIITTVAGTGVAGDAGDGGLGINAQLDGPFGIGIAPGGFLYIAEGGGHCVRMLRLSDGVITTVAR